MKCSICRCDKCAKRERHTDCPKLIQGMVIYVEGEPACESCADKYFKKVLMRETE